MLRRGIRRVCLAPMLQNVVASSIKLSSFGAIFSNPNTRDTPSKIMILPNVFFSHSNCSHVDTHFPSYHVDENARACYVAITPYSLVSM